MTRPIVRTILYFLPCPMHRGDAYLSVFRLLQGISRCFWATDPVGPVEKFISVRQEPLHFGNGSDSDFLQGITPLSTTKEGVPLCMR